jgi:hypothetical protein
MGKRSEFPRLPRDAYDTPAAAAAPLLPHLAPRTRFVEPCAGNGCLIEHLEAAGHVCVGRYDLPDDARAASYAEAKDGAIFVTNPPWSRPTLHQIIINLSNQSCTWLLIDADWPHTLQSIPFMPRLRAIVSIGRVRWIPDSPYDGKDNCAWLLFDRVPLGGQTAIHFIGRVEKEAAGSSGWRIADVSARRPGRAAYRLPTGQTWSVRGQEGE